MAIKVSIIDFISIFLIFNLNSYIWHKELMKKFGQNGVGALPFQLHVRLFKSHAKNFHRIMLSMKNLDIILSH